MHRRLLTAVLAVCLGALVMVVAAACSSAGTSGGTTGTGMMGGGSGATSYSSIGQRIWLTGVGADGREIAHSAPRVSLGALMMGGGGCGSCHGPDGRGGTIRMMTGASHRGPRRHLCGADQGRLHGRDHPNGHPRRTGREREAAQGHHASLADERRGPGRHDRLPEDTRLVTRARGRGEAAS